MTHTPETSQIADPEGSIFLPSTERELEKYRLALLLGRGPGEGKTPDELLALHTAAGEALKALHTKVLPEMVAVALASEI